MSKCLTNIIESVIIYYPIMKTREQLSKEGKLNSPPYSYYKVVMDAIAKDKESFKMFHSDVYYVRAALEARTGWMFSLPSVEKAMKAEGWSKK